MTFLKSPLLWSSAAIVCLAGSAGAQDLATEILEEYFADTAASGLTVDVGAKTVSGNTVEWTNIVMSPTEGDGEFTIPWMKAKELGNGQVELDIAPKSAGRFGADDIGELVVDVSIEGDRQIVSGPSDARIYAIETDSFKMSLRSSEGFKIDITGQGSTANWVRSGTDVPNFVGASSVEEVRINMDVSQDGQVLKLEQIMSDVNASFDLDAVAPEAIGNGIKQEMTLQFGKGSSSTEVSQPGVDTIIEQSFEGGDGTYALADGAISMAFNGQAQSGKITMPALGMPPLEYSVSSSEVLFEMPLTKSDDFGQGNLKFAMRDVVLSDQIWGMFDPSGALPREPANINFDMGVSMKWLVDITNPESIDPEAEFAAPAEIDKIDIRDITIQMAGASVSAAGAGKMNNDGPFPMPYGALDIDVRGAFALIDKLAHIGLIPTEQAMMAKGMPSMFTSPGSDGDDHLTSLIEMKKSGSIVVNGVPVN